MQTPRPYALCTIPARVGNHTWRQRDYLRGLEFLSCQKVGPFWFCCVYPEPLWNDGKYGGHFPLGLKAWTSHPQLPGLLWDPSSMPRYEKLHIRMDVTYLEDMKEAMRMERLQSFDLKCAQNVRKHDFEALFDHLELPALFTLGVQVLPSPGRTILDDQLIRRIDYSKIASTVS